MGGPPAQAPCLLNRFTGRFKPDFIGVSKLFFVGSKYFQCSLTARSVFARRLQFRLKLRLMIESEFEQAMAAVKIEFVANV